MGKWNDFRCVKERETKIKIKQEVWEWNTRIENIHNNNKERKIQCWTRKEIEKKSRETVLRKFALMCKQRRARNRAKVSACLTKDVFVCSFISRSQSKRSNRTNIEHEFLVQEFVVSFTSFMCFHNLRKEWIVVRVSP